MNRIQSRSRNDPFLPTEAKRRLRSSGRATFALARAHARGVQAKDPVMERWVAEIRLRARRRVGELSAALDTSQGARSELLPSHGKKLDALAAAGLSTSEAHRCEQLASVPVAAFDAYLESQIAAGKTVTADEVVRMVKKRTRKDETTEAGEKASSSEANRCEQLAQVLMSMFDAGLSLLGGVPLFASARPGAGLERSVRQSASGSARRVDDGGTTK